MPHKVEALPFKTCIKMVYMEMYLLMNMTVSLQQMCTCVQTKMTVIYYMQKPYFGFT
jgi:hypothetical protein